MTSTGPAATRPTGMTRPRGFSTADLPEADRIARWEQYNSASLIALAARTIGPTPLNARELNVELPSVGLARVSAGPHIVERTFAHIDAAPVDSIVLYFNLAGDAFLYRDDGVERLRPGELLVLDADIPFVRGFSGGLEELVVRIPRATFVEHTGIDKPVIPLVTGFTGNPATDALARLVGAAVSPDRVVDADETTLLDLVTHALTNGRNDSHSAHLAAAKAFIALHLTDRGLGAAMVADGIGLSRRQLSRVFAGADTTVPGYIRTRRLDRAHALLSRNPTESIAEVAAASGFSSPAHFSTAFSKRFGHTPRDVVRQR